MTKLCEHNCWPVIGWPVTGTWWLNSRCLVTGARCLVTLFNDRWLDDWWLVTNDQCLMLGIRWSVSGWLVPGWPWLVDQCPVDRCLVDRWDLAWWLVDRWLADQWLPNYWLVDRCLVNWWLVNGGLRLFWVPIAPIKTPSRLVLPLAALWDGAPIYRIVSDGSETTICFFCLLCLFPVITDFLLDNILLLSASQCTFRPITTCAADRQPGSRRTW